MRTSRAVQTLSCVCACVRVCVPGQIDEEIESGYYFLTEAQKRGQAAEEKERAVAAAAQAKAATRAADFVPPKARAAGCVVGASLEYTLWLRQHQALDAGWRCLPVPRLVSLACLLV